MLEPEPEPEPEPELPGAYGQRVSEAEACRRIRLVATAIHGEPQSHRATEPEPGSETPLAVVPYSREAHMRLLQSQADAARLAASAARMEDGEEWDIWVLSLSLSVSLSLSLSLSLPRARARSPVAQNSVLRSVFVGAGCWADGAAVVRQFIVRRAASGLTFGRRPRAQIDPRAL